MKQLKLILLIVFAFTGACFAQSKIPASISIIDPQSNALVPVTSDAANLFKISLVNLVTNTSLAKLQAVTKFGPGKRSIVITQADPQANGNAYQLVLQRTFLGTVNVVYTFQYNVDQNKLYYYDPDSGNWLEQAIQGDNVLNLNNCKNYGMFNAQQAPAPAPAPAPDNTQAAPADDNADAVAPDTSVQVATVPPALPDYDQPECPTEGYLWQPGYWAYSLDTQGYYWVPGVWVSPPTVGYLWTPPYWGFVGGLYVFHAGYWGASIGFYGGIDYGYGYGGVGFVGGSWEGGYFRYNTVIVRVGPGFHHVYEDRSVYHERGRYRYSFNGRGGYMARPNAHEIAAMHERHIMATHDQIRNQRMAREDKTQFASHNGGRPGNLAAARPPERPAARTNDAHVGGAGAAGTRPESLQGGRTGAVAGATKTQGGAPGGTAGPRTAGTPGTPGTRPGGAPGAGAPHAAGVPGRPTGAPTGAPGGAGGAKTAFGSAKGKASSGKLPKASSSSKKK